MFICKKLNANDFFQAEDKFKGEDFSSYNKY
jgi:hypothetical protein